MEIWKNVSLRLILKDKGGNWHYVYQFVDPYLGVEISSKKEGNKWLRSFRAQLLWFPIYIYTN